MFFQKHYKASIPISLFVICIVMLVSSVFADEENVVIGFYTEGQKYGIADLDSFWLSNANDDSGAYFEAECEDYTSYTIGQLIYRSNAMNKKVWGSFGTTYIGPGNSPAQPGWVRYAGINLKNDTYIKVRYSRYQDLPDDIPIQIYVNDELRASFQPIDQRSWNTFTSTEWIRITPLAAPAGSMWNIAWFGCDCGHENVYELQRDGSPICGSGNCPNTPGLPPAGCWGGTVNETSYNDGGTSWEVSSDGSLKLGHQKDVQVYGGTWLCASEPVTINPTIRADVGRIWLNDVDYTGSKSLTLKAGWNHLEFTSYNQNQDTGIDIIYDFTGNDIKMAATPENADCNSNKYTYYIPHYMAYPEIMTEVAVSNLSNTGEASVHITAYNNSGESVFDDSGDVAAGGKSTWSIPEALYAKGWILVNSNQPLGCYGFYGTTNHILLANTPMTASVSKSWVIPHIAQDRYWDSEVKICNPNDKETQVALILMNPDGAEYVTKQYTVPAYGGIQIELGGLTGNDDFKGRVNISADADIVPFVTYNNFKGGGIHYNGLSPVPVTDE